MITPSLSLDLTTAVLDNRVTFTRTTDATNPATYVGYVGLTNAENTGTSRSTGVGTIKFADATARDNAGFVKIYIGSTAYYVPIFAAN